MRKFLFPKKNLRNQTSFVISDKVKNGYDVESDIRIYKNRSGFVVIISLANDAKKLRDNLSSIIGNVIERNFLLKMALGDDKVKFVEHSDLTDAGEDVFYSISVKKYGEAILVMPEGIKCMSPQELYKIIK